MNDKELANLLKYSNPKELYIITWNNLLKMLVCPFDVIVLIDIGALSKGQTVQVDMIKVTYDLKTVYVINGYAYYYCYFDIIVDE